MTPPLGPVCAVWHGTLPECGTCNQIGLSLTLEDDTVLRLRLSATSAREIAETLRAALIEGPRLAGQCPTCAHQSASSSGNPQSAGSTPVEGENT